MQVAQFSLTVSKLAEEHGISKDHISCRSNASNIKVALETNTVKQGSKPTKQHIHIKHTVHTDDV